uniref:Uncharacterized protein n=1 Tax=Anopheles quadriannulatus TaxID=34691 RepID=A0A182XTF7_ANOQN
MCNLILIYLKLNYTRSEEDEKQKAPERYRRVFLFCFKLFYFITKVPIHPSQHNNIVREMLDSSSSKRIANSFKALHCFLYNTIRSIGHMFLTLLNQSAILCTLSVSFCVAYQYWKTRGNDAIFLQVP